MHLSIYSELNNYQSTNLLMNNCNILCNLFQLIVCLFLKHKYRMMFDVFHYQDYLLTLRLEYNQYILN